MSKYLTNLDIEYPLGPVTPTCSREAAALYLYLIARKFKIPTGGIAKVILRQAPTVTEQTLLDISTYAHPLRHLDKLPPSASEEEARKALIDEITDALLALAELKGWDQEPIRKLHAEVIKRSYRFEGTAGKSAKNSTKTMTATAAWRSDQYLHIGVLLQGSNKTPECFIAATRIGISLGLFESLLGPLEWLDDETVRLFHGNKRDYWDISVTTQTAKFHFPRAESGNAHGQYDLAKMYLDGWIVEQDIAKAEEWLKKSATQNFPKAVKLLQRLEAGETDLADPLMNSMR